MNQGETVSVLNGDCWMTGRFIRENDNGTSMVMVGNRTRVIADNQNIESRRRYRREKRRYSNDD